MSEQTIRVSLAPGCAYRSALMANQTQKYCPTCQREVLATREGINHVLHLLITLFTCGLWVIPWFIMSMRVGGWRCSVCGNAQWRVRRRG